MNSASVYGLTSPLVRDWSLDSLRTKAFSDSTSKVLPTCCDGCGTSCSRFRTTVRWWKTPSGHLMMTKSPRMMMRGLRCSLSCLAHETLGPYVATFTMHL